MTKLTPLKIVKIFSKEMDDKDRLDIIKFLIDDMQGTKAMSAVARYIKMVYEFEKNPVG